MTWESRAACAEHRQPEQWFPGKGDSTRQAKALCQGCPVAAECLDYALVNYIKFGVWGGKTEQERRRLRPKLAHQRAAARQRYAQR